MARIEVDRLELDYELIGPEGGQLLVITPGGRYPRHTAGVPELGGVASRAQRISVACSSATLVRTA